MSLFIRHLVFFGCLLLSSPAHAWTGRVVAVADGDTLTVLHDGQREIIRLYGVDCPERAQAYGPEAKQFVRKAALRQLVRVEPVDKDRYKRTVALVYLAERCLNEQVVRAGLAWVFPRYCKRAFCPHWKVAEDVAREQKLGLWHDSRPSPPWNWRKKQRALERKQEQRRPTAEPADGVLPYHGNVRSRVFHRRGCSAYGCKHCTRGLATRQEAIDAGFRPCGGCRP